MNIQYYFDSSAVISMLVNDQHAEEALGYWSNATTRLSSTLTLFETYVSVHRYGLRMPPNLVSNWKSEISAWLVGVTNVLTVQEVDSRILDQVKNLSILGNCRTLDAIHIATAMVFRQEGALLKIISFDKRLNQVAQNCGFEVI